ncbi:MAG: hypothetical protein ACJA2M_001330 [Polaribacter sp.]|jgi:hypothetical protein
MENTIVNKEGIKEICAWNYSDTCVKYDGYDRVTMLEPTAKNMHRLMEKINELTKQVNKLTDLSK